VKFDATWPTNTSVRKRSGFLFWPKAINGDGRWWQRDEWWEECAHKVDRNGKDACYVWEPICWADNVIGSRAFLVEDLRRDLPDWNW